MKRGGVQVSIAKGQAAKRKALARHEENSEEPIDRARAIADELIAEQGFATADLVRMRYEKRFGVGGWGPWAGAIFKDRTRYRTNNEFKPSAIVKHKGCILRVWRAA